MKKSKSILILVGFLVVLLGAYFYLDKKSAKSDDVASEPSKLELTKFDVQEVSTIKLTSSDETLELVNLDSRWVVKANPTMKLDQQVVSGVALSFSTLMADKIIDENPVNLKDYGLENPSVTAEAELKDGSKKIVYLGNLTPDNNTYYLMMKDDPKLYAVPASYVENLKYTLSDVRDGKIHSIDTQNLNYVKVTHEDGTIVEIKKGETKAADSSNNSWLMVQPYANQEVDSGRIANILGAIPYIKANKFIEEDGKDLVKYGLDKPSLVISMKDAASSSNIYFGKDLDDTYIYFKTDTSNAVYATKKDYLYFFESPATDFLVK